jgi:hypothetical protein
MQNCSEFVQPHANVGRPTHRTGPVWTQAAAPLADQSPPAPNRPRTRLLPPTPPASRRAVDDHSKAVVAAAACLEAAAAEGGRLDPGGPALQFSAEWGADAVAEVGGAQSGRVAGASASAPHGAAPARLRNHRSLDSVADTLSESESKCCPELRMATIAAKAGAPRHADRQAARPRPADAASPLRHLPILPPPPTGHGDRHR